MIREINFDMDGTLADFYGVENWLSYLVSGDESKIGRASCRERV